MSNARMELVQANQEQQEILDTITVSVLGLTLHDAISGLLNVAAVVARQAELTPEEVGDLATQMVRSEYEFHGKSDE